MLMGSSKCKISKCRGYDSRTQPTRTISNYGFRAVARMFLNRLVTSMRRVVRKRIMTLDTKTKHLSKRNKGWKS